MSFDETSVTDRPRDLGVADLILELRRAGPCLPERTARSGREELAEIEHVRAWTLVFWKAQDLEALRRLGQVARDSYRSASRRVQGAGLSKARDVDTDAMLDQMVTLRAILGATLDAQKTMLDLLAAGVATTLGQARSYRPTSGSIGRSLDAYTAALPEPVKPPPAALVTQGRSLDKRTDTRDDFQTHPRHGAFLWPVIGATTDLARNRLYPPEGLDPGSAEITQLLDDTFDYIARLIDWLTEVLSEGKV